MDARRTEAGQAMVFLAIFFLGLLAFVGIVTDVAMIYWNRADLASRADSAALAGGAELTNTVRAQAKAEQYLALHNITSANHTINISFRKLIVNNDVITVHLERPVPMAFMRLFGFDTVVVSADAEVHATSWAGDQSWTMFRGGPARTGYQPCNGLDAGIESVQYSFGHRWEVNDGANHRSTPATYQDKRANNPINNGNTFIVVGSNQNNNGGNGAAAVPGPKVYAFDAVSGNTLWTVDLGTKVRSSPLIAVISGFNNDDPVVYLSGHNGRTYALDARTGTVLWTSPNDNDDFEEDGLYRASPALVDGYIYMATSRGNVYKLNATTGAIVWRSTPFPGSHPYPNANVPANWVTTGWGTAPGNIQDYWGYTQIFSTPNVVDIPGVGKVVFVIAHGKKEWDWPGATFAVHLFAIDANTGARLWASDAMGGNNRDAAAVGEVDTNYDGNPDTWRAFVNPTDGYVYAFNVVDGINSGSGTWAWSKYTGYKKHRSDPVLYCGVVFGGNERAMYALTAAEGYSIWDDVDSDGAGPDQANPEYNLTDYTSWGERKIPGGVKSAPALVDGIILVGANRTSTGGSGGSMWALDARTGRDLGHWNTTDYNPAAGNGLGPAGPPSGNNGDVRSGVVVAEDFNAYFGSNDSGIYQVLITAVLILIK